MPDTDKTNNPHDDCENSNQPAEHVVLRRIFTGGIIACIAIIGDSICQPYLTERVKFATTNLLSLFVLIVVLVQAVIYRKQWEAMQSGLEETRKIVRQNERSIELARQSMIYAQRAYVTIPNGDVEGFDNGDVIFRLKVENFGNTPANDVEVISEIGIASQPRTDAKTKRSRTQIGLLSPTQVFPVKTSNIEFNGEREDMNEGKTRLYCWGVISYRDIFKETRRTKFCFVKETSTTFVPNESGNEAE